MIIVIICLAIPCAMLAYLFFVIGGLGSAGGGPELPAPSKGPTSRQLAARQKIADLRAQHAREDADLTAAFKAGKLGASEYHADLASNAAYFNGAIDREARAAW